MINLLAKVQLHTERGAVVRIETSRTFYQVAVDGTEVTIFAPGLQESFTIGEEGSPIPDDPDLSDEGKAALAVIYFEESNR
jgi:hypothetical protein